MQVQALSLTVMSGNPSVSARFYTQLFGFTPTAELPWFVSLQHPQHRHFNLDLIQMGHMAAGVPLKDQQTSGVMLALVVEDVEGEERRLRQEGIELTMPVTVEPWGQKRLQIQAPDGVILELLQFVPPDTEWLSAQAAVH